MAQPLTPADLADLASIELSTFRAVRSIAIGQGNSESEADAIAVAAAKRAADKALRDSTTFNVIPPVNPYIGNNVYNPGDPNYVKILDVTLNQQPSNVAGIPAGASNTIGTIISTINQQLTHECGTTEQIKLFVDQAVGFAAEIAKGIRKGVELALTALGITPAVGGLAAKIRYIAAKVANITFYVKLINNFINDVVLVIAKIKALIEYILSLPKKLLALFAKCLKEAQDAIKKGIFEVLSAGTNIAGDDLGDAIKSLNELRNETTQLISETNKVIEAPSRIISAITNPAALSDNQTTELIRELFPDNPPISEVVATYGNGRP